MSKRFSQQRRHAVSAHGLFVFVALAISFTVLACALCACGSSSDGKVVATVGKRAITQGALSSWMATTVGGDYRELNSETSPEGLVADPPDYSRCIAAAKQIPTASGKKPSDSQLALKCRELYTAVKEESLSFLIVEIWASEQAAEHGQHVSGAELNRAFQRYRTEQWPSPAQFKSYLTERHRSVSDERALLKRNLLTEKILGKLKAQAGSQQAFVKLVKAEDAKWTSRTHCKPGYRAQQCEGYASTAGVTPSAAVLVEQLKAGG